MRAALMGVGSLGTIIGALVAKNGGDLTLVDANKAHVDALNQNGATVIGKMELNAVPVKAITPEEMDGIYDLVILLAKQTYNDVALRQLLPHLGKNSVCVRCKTACPRSRWAESSARSGWSAASWDGGLPSAVPVCLN